jgi:hypothetical protein
MASRFESKFMIYGYKESILMPPSLLSADILFVLIIFKSNGSLDVESVLRIQLVKHGNV